MLGPCESPGPGRGLRLLCRPLPGAEGAILPIVQMEVLRPQAGGDPWGLPFSPFLPGDTEVMGSSSGDTLEAFGAPHLPPSHSPSGGEEKDPLLPNWP